MWAIRLSILRAGPEVLFVKKRRIGFFRGMLLASTLRHLRATQPTSTWLESDSFESWADLVRLVEGIPRFAAS
jgi:hypothetical protein